MPKKDENFDSIRLHYNYIRCYSANKMEFYDKSGKKIDIKGLKAVYGSGGSLQCIIKDEIKWLDSDWNFHDTSPLSKSGFCGNISSTERKIEKINDAFYDSYSIERMGQKVNKDSFLIFDNKSVHQITYLNNQTSDAYNDYSDLNAIFSFPYETYVVIKEEEQQLIALTNKKTAKKSDLILERDYLNKSHTEKDSITTLINKLEDDIVIEILFTGNFESFGYYHPIRFESGGLFGYYPQNEIAKYKRLEKFNFFYAEFEDKDGRVGWLDVYGKEYYKNE